MTARALPRPAALTTVGFGAGLAVGLSVIVALRFAGLLGLAGLAVILAVCALMLRFGVERVLVGAILLNVPLQLDVNLGYRPDTAAGAVEGVALSVTTLSLLGLVFYRALVADPPGSPAVRRVARPWAPLAAFVAVATVSTVVAGNWVLSAYGLVLLVQCLVLLIYLSLALRTVRDIRWAINMLLLGLFAQGALMAVQRFFGVFLLHEVWQASADGQALDRVSGTLKHPNIAGGYLSVVLVVALAVVLSDADRRQRWLAAAALATGGAGLLWTFSRGGLLGFAAGCLTLFALATRRRLLRAGSLLIFATGLAVSVVLVGDELLLRAFADDSGSAQSRWPLMLIAIDMAVSAPLAGVGINNFGVALPAFVTPEFSQQWIYAVHNQYLLVAAETGILGLAAFVAFLVMIGRSARLASRVLPDDLALLAMGCIGALVARVVHMQVDYFNRPSQWEPLIVIAAIAAALAYQGVLAAGPNAMPRAAPRTAPARRTRRRA